MDNTVVRVVCGIILSIILVLIMAFLARSCWSKMVDSSYDKYIEYSNSYMEYNGTNS